MVTNGSQRKGQSMTTILDLERRFERGLRIMFGKDVVTDRYGCSLYGDKVTCGPHLSIGVPMSVWTQTGNKRAARQRLESLVRAYYGDIKLVREPGARLTQGETERRVTFRAEFAE
jgi:hypothetical protein